MSEPWFSEVPPWLPFFALLAILAWPVEQGRFKTAVMTIWIAAIAAAGLLAAAAGVAFVVQQPPHVVRSLTLLAFVFGFAFGVSFPTVRRTYRQAELRKMTAADL